jgi:hypothetical protein
MRSTCLWFTTWTLFIGIVGHAARKAASTGFSHESERAGPEATVRPVTV